MEFKREIRIGNKLVGESHPPLIIAEAGVAHFGSVLKAKGLVDLAVDAGADVVKFQFFDVDNLIANDEGGWKSRLGSRQLSFEDYSLIKEYCDQKGIMFMATAHDEPSFDRLIQLDLPAFKIGSGERGNIPFLKKIFSLDKPVILSTGMYEEEDIQVVVELAKAVGKADLVILHCVTRYPAEPSEINLRFMQELEEKYSVLAGYSDHTEGTSIPLGAVALGAKVIEKHISLDFNVPNAQDWKVSCGPADLKKFVLEVRSVSAALGTAKKQMTSHELESRQWATKSLYLKRSVSKGDLINEKDLVALRPGGGMSPGELDNIVGRKYARDKEVGKMLEFRDVEK